SRRGRISPVRRVRRSRRLRPTRATVEPRAIPIIEMAEHQAPAQVLQAQPADRGLARARGGNVASVETTGPTVDDAIDAALEKLDLDEDQVELEVLSEGGDGQPARVRARPRAEGGVEIETVEVVVVEETGTVEWDES